LHRAASLPYPPAWLAQRAVVARAGRMRLAMSHVEEKVFCIGLNKTGTTSLKNALAHLGYSMGNQGDAELLMKHYLERDFAPIVEFCTTANAFQDVPFSLPYIYVVLDEHFPNAKFVLSLRDSADQWYASWRNADAAWLGAGSPPAAETLKAVDYAYPGFIWDVHSLIVRDTARREREPYARAPFIEFYELHRENVRRYFSRGRRNLIEINVARHADYLRLCDFLGREPAADGFPLLNKTPDLSGRADRD
jgi:hypothetical protein